MLRRNLQRQNRLRTSRRSHSHRLQPSQSRYGRTHQQPSRSTWTRRSAIRTGSRQQLRSL